ncbi:unnamed protein product, partial [Brassica rapa]
MVGKTHGQSQMAKQNQQLTALQEINDWIAQLRKRNKERAQRPQQGERRFGDAPEAVYVEPKPPDPSRINQHPTSQTHTHHVANSRFDHKSFADKIELFTFSGGRSYLFSERNLDEWFHYNNILKEERLSYAIDQLRGNAFKWWVQEEDDRCSKIRKIYPRRYLTHVSKEKPEPVIVQVKAKVSPILDKSVNESTTTCMSHLSLSKNGDVTGTKEHEFKGEEPPGATPVMDHKMVQDTMQSMLFKEAKPILKVSHQGKINDSYKLIEVPKKEPDHKLSHEFTPKWKPKSEQSIVQVPKPMVRFILDQHVLNISMTDIMHLLFVQSYIVSRSKPCQEGGDVVVTKSMVQPESHQTVQTGHLGGTSDRGSVQGVYLYNQKDFQHETNFIGFDTQEGVHPNWNRAKIFTEQEVMNFTSQKFPSPSICEYPTLEGDSSPRKERPEEKPIIGVKRSFSDFQKAQYQEKWPRNYEVMIQSPKPAKPVLHLPQLEASRFKPWFHHSTNSWVTPPCAYNNLTA